MSIAISPTDSDILLVSANTSDEPYTTSWGVGYYYSTDGGTIWYGDDFPPAGGGLGDPASAIGRKDPPNFFFDDIFYVGFGGPEEQQNIMRSTDLGSSWSTFLVALGAPFYAYDKNHLAVDNLLGSPYEGYLYSGWTHTKGSTPHHIEVARSTDKGETWEPPPLDPHPEISAGISGWYIHKGVNIQIGRSANPFIKTNIYATWGVHWQPPLPDFEDAIGFNKSLDGGVNWLTAREIISPIKGIYSNDFSPYGIRVNSWPSMAVDVNGRIYIVWTNVGEPRINTGDPDIYLIYSDTEGAIWSDPIRVNDDPIDNGANQWFPWATCDPVTGALSVVYYDGRNDIGGTQAEIYAAVSNDGGKTFKNCIVSDEPFTVGPIPDQGTYSGDYIGIAAREGNIYPSWNSLVNLAFPSENNSQAYVSPLPEPVDIEIVITDSATAYNGGKKIIKDGNNLHTVYMKEYSPHPNPGVPKSIVYALSTDDGTNWSTFEVAGLFCRPRHPSLAVDSQGKAHVVFVGEPGCPASSPPSGMDAVYYYVHDGTGWIPSQQTFVAGRGSDFNKNYLFRPSIAIGTDDYVHIAWHYSNDDNPSSTIGKIEYWSSKPPSIVVDVAVGGAFQFDYPSIAVDQLVVPDRPNIICEFNAPTMWPEIAHFQELFGSWHPIATVSNNSGITPSLDADDNGNLHATWKRPLDGNLYHDIYTETYCTGLPVVQWMQNCRPGDLLVRQPISPNVAEFPSIHSRVATWFEQNPDDDINPDNWDVYYANYDNVTDSWTPATLLRNTKIWNDYFPHVYVTPEGINDPPDCRMDFFYTRKNHLSNQIDVFHEYVTNENCYFLSASVPPDLDSPSILSSSPNPFQSVTEISYEIPQDLDQQVSIKIYDLAGRVIRDLVEGKKEEGRYIDRWDGRDKSGRLVPSGIYFFKMKAGKISDTKKVIFLR
jgi:hypothetical protein